MNINFSTNTTWNYDAVALLALANQNCEHLDEKQFKQGFTFLVSKVCRTAFPHVIPPAKYEEHLESDVAAVVRETNPESRVKAFLNGDIFRIIRKNIQPSLDSKDDEYYLKNITAKMVAGCILRFEQSMGDLSVLKEEDVKVFLCDMAKDLQSAEERHQMRVTMELIPEEWYNQTLPARMKIGTQITTKEVCKDVISLFEKDKNPAVSESSLEAEKIFKEYQELLIDSLAEFIANSPVDKFPHPEKNIQALKDNLIVSLQTLYRLK